MLLVLALNPPAGPHGHLAPNGARMRGAMIERGEHPEWRQFLMLAAIQRADELNRLRDLPDTPTRTDDAPTPPKVAGLPTERTDTDPDPDDDDNTGSITQTPSAIIPVEIGEPSTFELPVAAPEERPPVIRSPQRVRSRNESRLHGAHHARRAAAKTVTPPPFNLFDALFGAQKYQQTPTVSANTGTR